MTKKEILKKQIIYRSTHRGTKEMDLLLGNFVKKHVDELSNSDLLELEKLLLREDEVLSKWYFENKQIESLPDNKVYTLFKNFKI